LTRKEALKLVRDKIDNANLVKHTLAVEAVMRRLAGQLGEDVERWGLAGLLHDIDYSLTSSQPERHSIVGAEMLEEMGIDPEIVEAVRAHNDAHGLPRNTSMAKALYSADPLTGLIVAAALVHPQKKLEPLDTGFVMNRFKEKSFARGARRDAISACSELGLSVEDFVGAGLEAMKGIADDLGL